MSTQVGRSQLTRLIELAIVEQQYLVNGLSLQERERQGSFEDWSCRDMILHNAAWHRYAVRRLHAMAGKGEMPIIQNHHEVNRRIFDENHMLSWPEALAVVKEEQQDLLDVLQEVPEEAFFEGGPYPWMEGKPLWRYILKNGFTHPLMHSSYYHIQHGSPAEADRLQKIMYHEAIALDDSPLSMGTVRYNMGCYCALAGQTERALGLVADALTFVPALVNRARQDTDLRSLHNLAEFQKLLES